MTAAERDQGETDEACWICNPPDPGPCPEHPTSPNGLRGCHACVREAFAEWVRGVRAHVRTICDGSGQRDEMLACPGCYACCTDETPCPAFALPDEPWISRAEREKPCVFCGEAQEKHRRMPPTPEPPPVRGFRVLDGESEITRIGLSKP